MNKYFFMIIIIMSVFGCGIKQAELNAIRSEIDSAKELYIQSKLVIVEMRKNGMIGDDIWNEMKLIDERLTLSYNVISDADSIFDIKSALELAEAGLRALLPIVKSNVKDERVKLGIEIFFKLLKYKREGIINEKNM